MIPYNLWVCGFYRFEPPPDVAARCYAPVSLSPWERSGTGIGHRDGFQLRRGWVKAGAGAGADQRAQPCLSDFDMIPNEVQICIPKYERRVWPRRPVKLSLGGGVRRCRGVEGGGGGGALSTGRSGEGRISSLVRVAPRTALSPQQMPAAARAVRGRGHLLCRLLGPRTAVCTPRGAVTRPFASRAAGGGGGEARLCKLSSRRRCGNAARHSDGSMCVCIRGTDVSLRIAVVCRPLVFICGPGRDGTGRVPLGTAVRRPSRVQTDRSGLTGRLSLRSCNASAGPSRTDRRFSGSR